METKYHKLASEYAKIRAQAGVLKKAVIDEQTKGTNLREQLRQRETALRRSEQEVDSLGFRNKQLEHRVAVLQEEIALHEGRNITDKARGANKFLSLSLKTQNNKIAGHKGAEEGGGDETMQNALIFEELQKKIMENAHLTSLIDDKERDLQLHTDRVSDLEQLLEQRTNENIDLEKRLRREIETLQNRNAVLETKYEGAVSILGSSEDALSVSGSENTAFAASIDNKYTQEERISSLERDVAHWRAQYEVLQLTLTSGDTSHDNNKQNFIKLAEMLQKNGCNCSSSAAGITVIPNLGENKRCSETLTQPPTTEQIMYNRFSQKYEELLKAKLTAESHLSSYVMEMEHLQNCLENATHELKAKDEQISSINAALQMLEDDMTTTRMNYDEQISVLTEQIVSLSEQLAASK